MAHLTESVTRLIDEFENGRPNRFVPQRHLFVSAVVNEFLKLLVDAGK